MPTPVYYANCPDYTPEHLQSALGGILPGQIDAFGGVSHKRIMLKPNLLAWRRADDIACVHPKLIVETARFFSTPAQRKSPCSKTRRSRPLLQSSAQWESTRS